MMDDSPTAFCPRYHFAVELIGRRWTGAILRALLSGVSRFNDLSQTVPGLSDRMLAERLKELEGEGIVQRVVYPETPVRVEYSLTEKGRALESVIRAVAGWAENWYADEAAPHTPSHAPQAGPQRQRGRRSSSGGITRRKRGDTR